MTEITDNVFHSFLLFCFPITTLVTSFPSTSHWAKFLRLLILHLQSFCQGQKLVLSENRTGWKYVDDDDSGTPKSPNVWVTTRSRRILCSFVVTPQRVSRPFKLTLKNKVNRLYMNLHRKIPHWDFTILVVLVGVDKSSLSRCPSYMKLPTYFLNIGSK